ncbi:MAG: putative Ig [Ramlibacter sp.]|nr:putative Ig [Ramlibacter sp.]
MAIYTGTAGDDSLVGSTGDDELNGLEGNDTVRGGSGNDTLHAGWGNDYVDGGAGIDTVVLGGYRADYDVSWNATAKTYTLVHRASGFTTTTKWGSSYDWGNLIPDATAGDGYRLIGTADNNLLEGSAGFDYLSGGEGDDILNGFQQNDSLYGGGGNDTLHAGWGNDYVDGGAGIDTVVLGGYRADYDVSWNATAKTYTLVHRASGFTTTTPWCTAPAASPRRPRRSRSSDSVTEPGTRATCWRRGRSASPPQRRRTACSPSDGTPGSPAANPAYGMTGAPTLTRRPPEGQKAALGRLFSSCRGSIAWVRARRCRGRLPHGTAAPAPSAGAADAPRRWTAASGWHRAGR